MLDPVQPVPDSWDVNPPDFYGLKLWKSLTTESMMQNICAEVNFSRDSQPQVFTLVQ